MHVNTGAVVCWGVFGLQCACTREQAFFCTHTTTHDTNPRMSTKARKCDQLMVDYLELDGLKCTNEEMAGMAAGFFNSVKNNAVGEPVVEAMIKLNRAELLDYFLTKVPRTIPIKDKHIAFAFSEGVDDATVDVLVHNKPNRPTSHVLSHLINTSKLDFDKASAPFDRAVAKLGLVPGTQCLADATRFYVTLQEDGSRTSHMPDIKWYEKVLAHIPISNRLLKHHLVSQLVCVYGPNLPVLDRMLDVDDFVLDAPVGYDPPTWIKDYDLVDEVMHRGPFTTETKLWWDEYRAKRKRKRAAATRIGKLNDVKRLKEA